MNTFSPGLSKLGRVRRLILRCERPLPILLHMLLGVAALTVCGQAQQPNAAPMQLQQHPLAELKQTQLPTGDEYQLGGGDEITVTVIGRPELSGPQRIGPDGRVSMPVVGAIQLSGLSRDAAGQKITSELREYYTDVVANVQITKYGSNRVMILGDIEHPGVLFFDGTPSLLEAITRGGALIGDPKIRRMPKSCIIYRGQDQIGTVNLTDVFRSGDIRLHPNDIIYVPGDQDKLISVLGEVKAPGPQPLKEDSTLISLLADAGGITENAGNPMVQIINPKTGAVQRVSFKDLLKPSGKDVTLAVGDIIYVPKSGIAKVGYFLQQIGPATQIATIGTLVAQ